MKHLMNHFLLLSLFQTCVWITETGHAQQERSFFNKDLEAIGLPTPLPSSVKQILLTPGLYFVGDESNRKNWSHFMLLDSYVNDPSQLIGFILSRESLGSGENTKMQIVHAIPLEHGTVMLSPIVINSEGIISTDSKRDGRSGVMEITMDGTRPHGDHFHLISHNGGSGGKSLSMKRVSANRPAFQNWPTTGLFNSQTATGSLVVNGTILTVSNGDQSMTSSFKIMPINSNDGRIAGLRSATMNAQSRRYMVDSKVRKLAFFLKDKNNDEVFVVASPTHRSDVFAADFYCPKKRSILQIIADLMNSK